MSVNVYSQEALVQRAISWPLVQRRLQESESLARTFPIDLLQRGASEPPYFCHYMAWRLGTWESEAQINRLNELLRCAELIPGWEGERPLIESFEFADFWSLFWQLQVAEYLVGVGSNVRWCSGTSKKGSPDLSVTVGGSELFVECYVYRKSFGLEEFVNELVGRFGKWRADHEAFLKFSLPKGGECTQFLSELLEPFLDEARIGRFVAEAERAHPVMLAMPADVQNFQLYVEGENIDTYVAQPNEAGDPERYLDVALKEIARAKRDSNGLSCHRPNVVVANLLLSIDAQAALYRQRDLRVRLDAPDLPDDIDALSYCAIGIDARLSRSELLVIRMNNRSSCLADIATTLQS